MDQLQLGDVLTATFAHDAMSSGARRPQARFSALEWSVIALAQRDDPRSLSDPSRVSQAIAAIFSVRRVNRLADEHLEALRRTAVLTWHASGPLPKVEIAAFLLAGYSVAQFDLMLESITRGRLH
jgi:hypothetical protein